MEIVLDRDEEETNEEAAVDPNDPLVVPPDKSVVDIVEELCEEDGVDVPSIVDVEELISENGNEELTVEDVVESPSVVDELSFAVGVKVPPVVGEISVEEASVAVDEEDTMCDVVGDDAIVVEDTPDVVDDEAILVEDPADVVDDDAIVVEDTPDVVDEEAIVVEDEKQDSCELFKLS